MKHLVILLTAVVLSLFLAFMASIADAAELENSPTPASLRSALTGDGKLLSLCQFEDGTYEMSICEKNSDGTIHCETLPMGEFPVKGW